MLDTRPAVRERESGFTGEAERYMSKLGRASIPVELQNLKHSLSWPIDMKHRPARVACYFGDLGYSYLKSEDRKPHFAIDIQAPLHTPVLAPADAKVAMVDVITPMNEARGWADILLLDESRRLAYWLVHLDVNSIPYKMARMGYFGDVDEINVRQGEQLGKVGLFFNDLTVKMQRNLGLPPYLHPDVALPSEVEATFGRQYDHLHMEVHTLPESGRLTLGTFNPLDPVPLLERLY